MTPAVAAGDERGERRRRRHDLTAVRIRYETGPDRVAFRPSGADPPRGEWLSAADRTVRSLAAWR
ncbi:MAG: hypothetical protein A07HB70_01499 [uncultured archaeon A07HB70]|nr:MAG: hypothetical protein A07HB70_01499 [uncultured archaeon A07HB70]